MTQESTIRAVALHAAVVPLAASGRSGAALSTLAAVTPRGILALAAPGESRGDFESRIHRVWSVEVAPARPPHGALRKRLQTELAARLDGRDVRDPVPLDLPSREFDRKIYKWICDIPPGARQSFAMIAAAAGCPGAIRAVAAANRRAPVPVFIPTHRVVSGDGSLLLSSADPWSPLRGLLFEVERRHHHK